MLEIHGLGNSRGSGLSRRGFLKIGTLGLGGLTLADQLRLRSAAATGRSPAKDTAVILFWLDGGPSHLDMYDMKPDAPLELRGEFKEIATNVPGIRISDQLPLQAPLMDKMSVVRTVSHTNGGHGLANHWMLTGYQPALEVLDNLNPSCGSIVAKMRGANAPRVPAYVCAPTTPYYSNAAYLSVACNPFSAGSDPNSPDFRVRDLSLSPRVDLDRFGDRKGLLADIDNLRRNVDTRKTAEGYDEFYRDAFEIVTSEDCRRAFDIHKEDPRLRDRYGRNSWGQSALLARRLVQSGVTFVTVHAGGWDTHDNNFQRLKGELLPKYDQALAALVGDLADRGLDKRVLVVAYGEFGRTARINPAAGRDHWPGAFSVLFAGGGLKMGQMIGTTDAKGEAAKSRPFGPQDVLATIYHVLGIDYRHEFFDSAQRPMPILNEGVPIAELLG
jgi:hypothetical protein